MLVGIVAALLHGASLPMVMFFLGKVLDVMVTHNQDLDLAQKYNFTNITKIQDDFEDDIVRYSWAFGGLAMGAFLAAFLQVKKLNSQQFRKISLKFQILARY